MTNNEARCLERNEKGLYCDLPKGHLVPPSEGNDLWITRHNFALHIEPADVKLEQEPYTSPVAQSARERARELVGNVYAYFDDDHGELSQSAFEVLTNRIATALSATRSDPAEFLDCAMCDAPKSFVISPFDGAVGFCFKEQVAWRVTDRRPKT